MNIKQFTKQIENVADVVEKNTYAFKCALEADKIVTSKMDDKDFQRVVGSSVAIIISNMAMEDIESVGHFLALQENKKLLPFTVSVVAATIGILIDNEVL